jgi:hypothetical protein
MSASSKGDTEMKRTVVQVLCHFVTISIAIATLSVPATYAQAGINITFPSGATGVCNVKSQYGAAGNGTTDDTAAIQSALNACQTIYLPNDTYRITGALLWPSGYGNVLMVGQSQTGTVLQLDNSKFTNPSSPTTILDVCTNGGCPSQSNYFDSGIRNLTLNTGSGNAGVIGITFYASNMGAVRDVTVTSADGQGVYGFSLDASSANGPLLVKNLTVNGFQTGVEAAIGQVDSATLEHITVKNQTVAGMNVNGTVSLRDLESTNTVPALTMGGGFLTMIDSVLSGGSSGSSAISITGGDVLVRNITTSGYGHALTDGSTSLASPITEWTNDTVYDPFGGTGKTLGLTINETPAATWDNESTWAVVMASGGDDTAAIQSALNSGASTVCLCGGAYNVSSTLSVGGSVYHIYMVTGAYTNELPGDKASGFNGPVFQLASSGPSTVVFENILIQSGAAGEMEANPTSRTMVVMEGTANVSQTGTGSTYIEDVSSGLAISGGSAWARQLNPENCTSGTAEKGTSGICANNTGGNLWILGQKQEGGEITIQATGGKTELLGGLMYDCCGSGTNEFVINNSQFSARIDEANYGSSWWTNFVQDTENGVTDYVSDGGSTGGVLGLYTNATGSGSAPPAPVASAATSITSSGFTANWGASTGATGYYLDVSTSSSFSSFVSGYNNLSVGNVTSYAVSGLTASTTYYYRVRASNSNGTSGNSNTITVTTSASAPPAPVASAATSITSSGFTANWGASTGATGYYLDVSTSSSFSSFVSGYNNLSVGNVTSYAVSGLTAGTTYYYRVRASNSGGTSGNSNTITVTTSSSGGITFGQTVSSSSSGTTVAATFASANTTGDLIIANVSAAGATVSSVTDSAGNTYTQAISGCDSHNNCSAIWYAANIKAGSSNKVTATLSASVSWNAIDIAEFHGVSTLDKTASGTGTSTSPASSSATTTSANELIIGAGNTDATFTAAGSGFTWFGSAYGTGSEYEIVSSTGSYKATGTVSYSATWVMQMATFH